MLSREELKKLYMLRFKNKKSAQSQSGIKGTKKNFVYGFLCLGVVLIIIKIISLLAPDIITGPFASVVGATMIYCVMSVGFCLLLGYSGLASLGTAGFVGIGAYATFFCMQQWGLPYIATLCFALAVSILLGVAVGFISLRIEGIYLAIITLGLSEILRYALKAIHSSLIKVKNANLKLFFVSISDDGMYFVVVVMFIALLIFTANLIDSPTGRAMLAMKNSTSAAQAMGISLLKYRLLAFVISSVFATLAGMMYLLIGNAMTPSSEGETMLKLTLSLNVLGAVIIGGAKSLWGTMGGAVFIFAFNKLLNVLVPSFAVLIAPYLSILTGALVILVVMFYPGGLAQLITSIRYKAKINAQNRRLIKYGQED